MASSSDESFAWTNASNSSTSSSENDRKTNHKMPENGIDEDSDYGTNYKKKLHKKLLINNEFDDQSGPDLSDAKEKRSKCQNVDDDIISHKKKKMKVEPESDVNKPKKKKKIKLEQQQSKESLNDILNEEPSQHYNDLNLKVKEEQEIMSPPIKSKKERKKSNTSMSFNHDMDNSIDDIKKEKSSSELHETSFPEDNDETVTKKKKKKSRKRQHSLCEDDSVGLEDKCNDDISYSQHNDTESIEKEEKSPVKKEKSIHKRGIKKEYDSSFEQSELFSDQDSESKLNENKKIKSHENSLHNSSESHEKYNKRKSRISNGIKNEAADNTQMDTTIDRVDNTKSRKIKKFLKINENLKQIPPREHNEWSITADDEIWAIRCPQNIDVNSFIGTNIKLERKCKVKINDQTLVGKMNCEAAHITVLSSEHNDYVIKKLPLNGTLHLHTKIPKMHIPDNIVLDNETDFVPLPDTKKRHPLFGSNYKKAIKIPSSVAQKLNDTFNDSVSESFMKKKKKKKHKIDVDNEQIEEAHESALTDTICNSSKKKNRKRKHEDENDHRSKKRVKYNADTSAAWESEQAIEENLFNS